MAFIIYYCISIPYAILALFSGSTIARFAFLITVLLYSLIFSFSYKMGVDWVIYEGKFNDLSSGPVHEIGFSAALSIWKWLGLNYWFFPVLVKIFYIVTLYLLLRNFGKYAAVGFLSITLLAPVFLNDMLRQLLAAGFVNLAISCLMKNKNYWRSAALIFIACFFHISAIFVLPLLVLLRYRSLQGFIVFFVVALFLVSLVGIQPVKEVILMGKAFGVGGGFYEKVLLYASVERSAMTAGHIIRLVILLLAFWAYTHSQRLASDRVFSVIWLCFVLMIFYEFVFYDVETLWTRLREYFVFSIPFVLIIFFRFFASELVVILVCLVYSAHAFYNFISWEAFENYLSYRNVILEVFAEDREYAAERQNMVDLHWKYWTPRGARD